MFLLCLLLAGPVFYRPPTGAGIPEPQNRPVWVFFTDKGIFTETEYRAALKRFEEDAPALQRKRRGLSSRPGYDFDDLPVREAYIREVEKLGGRVRTVSRWLNAASFDLPGHALHAVRSLPFVHELRTVAERTEREPVEHNFPLSTVHKVRSQALDTAKAHRFYGPSYDQAQLMGVPELFYKGYFGSGVKLAIFDTGLKLKNVGVKGLRVTKQHDFISGDNFHTAGTPDWAPRPLDQLRYLGLAKAPVLDLWGSKARLIFVADSFSYGYSAPRRAIFASRSSDAGRSWSAPSLLVVSQPASPMSSHTFENLRLVRNDSITYLAFNDLLSSYRSRPRAEVYLGCFVNDVWQPPVRVGYGRCPDVCFMHDTAYFCFVETDSNIQFRKGSLETPQPNWRLVTTIRTAAPLEALRIAVDSTGAVLILGIDHHAGRMAQFRSTDRGTSFFPDPDPVASGAADFQLQQNGSNLFLFIADIATAPFTRLNLLRSTNFGLTWTLSSTLCDSLLTLGSFAADYSNQAGLNLAYETGGLLYRTSSTDQGTTWQTPALIDTAGFCYLPAAAADGSTLLFSWVKRGDDNVAWEESDTARFSFDQPDHGTRMASLICGYQPYSIVGIAPGVDLMVAKTEFHKTAGSRYYEYNLEEDTYVEALEWAESNGADIVSTSLGYRGWYSDDQLDGKTAPISRAAGIAAQKGLVVVTAIGNRDTTSYPWPRPYMTAPADAFGIIAAGGVERNLLPWRGTGTGPTADGRIKPELVALSDTVAVVAPDSVSGLEGSVGTSCATALIAGACALLKEAHPTWSADSLLAALFATATRSVPNCTVGFGVPQVDSAFRVFPPASGVSPTRQDELVPFPNPFLAGTNLKLYFAINLTRPSPEASISIFSTSGTLIDTLKLDVTPMSRPGRYSDVRTLDQIGAFWDGNNASGEPVSSGLYLAVLNTTYGSAVSKFCLVR